MSHNKPGTLSAKEILGGLALSLVFWGLIVLAFCL